MVYATSQSNFRSNMKKYMDAVVEENAPVYIVRGKETLVLEKEEKYKLMFDYINYDMKKGSLGKAILEEKLIEAGILPESKRFGSVREAMDDVFDDE